MADQYIARCTLTVNGQEISDFKSVEEGERDVRAPVNAMNKTGFVRKTQRHSVTVDYLPPATGAPYNWEELENGTLVIEYDGGRRVIYSGVYTQKIGAVKTDQENEQVQTVTLGAISRKEE